MADATGGSLWDSRFGPRRREGKDDPRRLDRMQRLACEHERRLHLDVAEILAPVVEARAAMALLPDQNGPAPAQVVHIDPGRELWIAVRDHMRTVLRIDGHVVDREFGAAGIDERRAVTLLPFAGDDVGQ